jgi:hypothetical protein
MSAAYQDAPCSSARARTSMNWDDKNWKQAARDYHAARNGRHAVVEIEPEKLKQLQRLMDDSISLERAYAELNDMREQERAAASTVEALMYSLRERGVKALEEPDTRRRLSLLSEEQLIEVGDRLLQLKPRIARPWTANEVEQLMRCK